MIIHDPQQYILSLPLDSFCIFEMRMTIMFRKMCWANLEPNLLWHSCNTRVPIVTHIKESWWQPSFSRAMLIKRMQSNLFLRSYDSLTLMITTILCISWSYVWSCSGTHKLARTLDGVSPAHRWASVNVGHVYHTRKVDEHLDII